MSDPVYAPPQATLDPEPATLAPFYVVGRTKFIVLAIATMNLYFPYWFYRNWRGYKEETGESIWPIARGIFAIFFVHTLFASVDDKLDRQGSSYSWSPQQVATIFVIVTILANVAGMLTGDGPTGAAVDLISTIGLAIAATAILVPAQLAINRACGDPEGSTNDRFTGANAFWIALGGLFWLMALLGFYMMIFAPEMLAENPA